MCCIEIRIRSGSHREKTTLFTLKTLPNSVLGLHTAVRSCTCSWCLKVYTGGLMHSSVHSKIQILGSLLGPKASWDQTWVCIVPLFTPASVKGHGSKEGSSCALACPSIRATRGWQSSLPGGHSHVVRAAFHDWFVGECVYTRQSLNKSWVSSQFAEGQAHADHCKQQYNFILSRAWLLPSPAAQFIMFFHCTITITCDSIAAMDSAWHTPFISTAPSGSRAPLSLLHPTPPTSRLARKWKICFQLAFPSTHKFSPFHLLLITVIPKWPPNELSISCKTCFHMNCMVEHKCL